MCRVSQDVSFLRLWNQNKCAKLITGYQPMSVTQMIKESETVRNVASSH
jgi:hypothetical protein